jgi:hypothetical protein
VDFKRQLRVDYLPDADHIFTGLDHQQLVVRGVVDWMRRFEGTPVMEPAREEVPGAVVLSKTPQRSRSHSGVGTGAGAAAL